MTASIIIPTYNEESDLVNCLNSLNKQSIADFEIIVVDDGSTDKTLTVLQNLQLTIHNFKFLRQKHRGPGAARNLGASKALGKVLVFVDADMTFDSDFVIKLIKPILAGSVKGTFSREEYVSNWENIWARCWNINEDWEDKRRHSKNYPETQSVFRAILKSEFDRVGGYTPGGYDDDWSLGSKLGYKAQKAEGANFYHRNPSSLLEVYKQSMWVASRKYKFGFIGLIIGLVRSLPPISIAVGIYKSVVKRELSFVIFKIIYDLGIFVGILRYLILNKTSK